MYFLWSDFCELSDEIYSHLLLYCIVLVRVALKFILLELGNQQTSVALFKENMGKGGDMIMMYFLFNAACLFIIASRES